MLASLSWLGELVPIDDLSPSFIADRLSMVGLEVEAVRDFREYLEKVVAARLVESEPLGGLTRCVLDAGAGAHVQVLCGAKNLTLGKVYPLATLGTELPEGAIKKMTVQGVDSDGMLASAWEILVGEDRSGILELDVATRPGTPLRELYPGSDWILEVGVTPNRGDALSHLGIARDLAAILGRPLTEPAANLEDRGTPASEQARVTIECPDECYRYCARVVNGARPGPSPLWMAKRLYSLGLRSINNIVDVTNYVMLELGLPLHAFDLGFLAGPEIIVKTYGPGTRFTTLDGQERTLSQKDNILICDRDRPVAIGGIMGGLNSEVKDKTYDVLLEGAMFNPVNVRRTSKSLGLSTDASFRFERGQDVSRCPHAVDRAASLIASLTGGSVAPGLIDNLAKPYVPKVISFSPVRCNKLLGTSYAAPEMLKVLGALGFGAEKDQGDEYKVTPPPFRLDVSQEADLFEEVVRVLDFENLPSKLPAPAAPAMDPPAPYILRERLRSFMAGQGFYELMSLSFLNANVLDKLELGPDDPMRARTVRLVNPLSEEMGVLRTSVVPSLLNAARLNQYHSQWDLALFEEGAVFLSEGEGERPLERQSLAALLSGPEDSLGWCEEKRGIDFFDLKGVVEALSASFLEEWEYVPDPGLVPSFIDRREGAAILRGGLFLGYMGLLKKSCAKNFGLKDNGGPVYLFEIFPETLPVRTVPAFKPYSQYPGITRDLAVLVDAGVSASELGRAIRESGDFPLKSLFVFDLYAGDRLPPGKKSLAFRLFFQDSERTLSEELVGGYFKGILENLEKKFQARLRD
jgi:phenylalanyl-tRNA synthetase beta chain